ncbi:MAG: hypothetical protein GXP05_04295 [Alphaproteobacteria bacterium]|nr:hypothetical protein [Alphaproteobacteria bacterium]
MLKAPELNSGTFFHPANNSGANQMKSEQEKIMLKDDGFPVTALLSGMKVVTVRPQNQGAWICLYAETLPHESAEVRHRYAECLPPERFQLALDPVGAHQLGLLLIQRAKEAIAPD